MIPALSVVPSPTLAFVWTPRLWAALIALCGAVFLDALDVSMVGVALPSIGGELGLSTSSLQWIVSGYVLGYGGFLLLGGRAADLMGRRRVFLIALAAFAAASLLGGLVSDPTLLVATRFIKGVAAAFTAPAGFSIITTTFPEGKARNRALSIYSSCAASGFSSGLIFGGFLTELGWRWTFLVPVPLALLILAAWRVIPAGESSPDRPGYDIPGAVTSTGSLLALVYAVVQGAEVGWLMPGTLGAFAVFAVLAVAFIVIERRTSAPLLRFGIFRNPSVVSANLVALVMFGCYLGFQLIGTLYMQSLRGWSPLGTALAFLPSGLLVAFGGPVTGALVNRFGARRVILAGTAAFVLGYAMFTKIDERSGYLETMLPGLLLIGLGFALCIPSVNIQATTGVADAEQGLASGLVQTSSQVGGAVILAVVTAVLASIGDSGAPREVIASYRLGLWVVTAMAAVGLLTSLWGNRRRVLR